MTATTIATAYRRATEDLVFLLVETPATADDSDTLEVDLGTYGIAEDGLLMIVGNIHTVANSTVAMEDPTTSVTSGTLTITLGTGGTINDIRTFLIVGRSEV